MIDKEKNDKIANAKNPYCTLVKFNELATDEDKEVRRAVISNPNCPSTILMKIFDYETKFYKYSENMLDIILHPNLPIKYVVPYYIRYSRDISFLYFGDMMNFTDIFERISEIIDDPNISNKTLEEIAGLNKSLYVGNHYRREEECMDDLQKLISATRRKAKMQLLKRIIKRVYIADDKTLEDKQVELEHNRLIEEQKQKDLKEAQKVIL